MNSDYTKKTEPAEIKKSKQAYFISKLIFYFG